MQYQMKTDLNLSQCIYLYLKIPCRAKHFPSWLLWHWQHKLTQICKSNVQSMAWISNYIHTIICLGVINVMYECSSFIVINIDRVTWFGFTFILTFTLTRLLLLQCIHIKWLILTNLTYVFQASSSKPYHYILKNFLRAWYIWNFQSYARQKYMTNIYSSK